MTDRNDGKASVSGSVSPISRRDVRLTRRALIGWLAASAAAGSAAAQNGALQGMKPNLSFPDLTVKDVKIRPELLDKVISSLPEAWTYSNPAGDLTTFSLFRARDLLNLNVKLVNMVVSGVGAARKIRRISASKPAYLILRFPPQAIAETTWPDLSSLPKPPPVIKNTEVADSRISGESRLSFIVPADVSEIPFSVKGVLDACATWPLNLDPRAIVPPAKFFPQGHEFDRQRYRLTKAALEQKAALKKNNPAAEAMLTRIAERITDAITTALSAGKGLSDAAIDNLINYEIAATLDPSVLSPEHKANKTLSGKSAKTYIDLQATSALLQIVSAYDSAGMIKDEALREAMKTPAPIAANATDLEIPFRLHMTPADTAGFSHTAKTVSHEGFTELWHTRMGTRIGDWVVSGVAEPLRALWADDFLHDKHPDLDTDAAQPWPLKGYDRLNLIINMTGFATRNSGYVAVPAMARHLRLTALGAAMEVRGEWQPGGSSLSLWHHISSIGRDQYVRVVYEGFLLPFGHRAAYVQISERKFTEQIGGGRVAGLMKKQFIIVRQPVREYPGVGQRFEGRDFPFTSVEITTKQTPDLKGPLPIAGVPDDFYEDGLNESLQPQLGFWPFPLVGSSEAFRFEMIGTDAAGRRTSFSLPLIFMDGKRQDGGLGQADVLDPQAGSPMEHLVKAYRDGLTPVSRQQAKLSNALIRFSKPVSAGGQPLGDDGEHDYHASSLTFTAWKATAEVPLGDARFYPGLSAADIEVPAVKALLGAEVKPVVTYNTTYLAKGFDPAANPADMVFSFAQKNIPPGVTDKFGGLVSPGLIPDGLSRRLGAVNKAAKLMAKNVDPFEFFPDSARLLGFVPIGSILNQLTVVADAAGKALPPTLKTVTNGDKVTTTYELTQPEIKSFEPLFFPQPPQGGPQLRILTTTVIDKAGGAPQASVDATLRNFRINLFGFIILNFRQLSMSVKPGSKTDVNPEFEPDTGVMFGGPLEFLNSMRDLIPMGGFSDPPALDVSPNGISSSYSLNLPDIAVGALTLQNVSLGAGFDLPFTGGGPSARFNFAERHNPFNLTVSLFGGGGFFAIALDTGGVRELEAALEFGAQIQLNLGVASGGVYVKAGIYFRWNEDLVVFSGYVEVGGHLNILGLITVSLVFHLELTYEKASSQSRLYGTATLTVEIEILFFSCSQKVTVERQFAGSDADPLFIEFCPGDPASNSSDTWSTYCRAFA